MDQSQEHECYVTKNCDAFFMETESNIVYTVSKFSAMEENSEQIMLLFLANMTSYVFHFIIYKKEWRQKERLVGKPIFIVYIMEMITGTNLSW